MTTSMPSRLIMTIALVFAALFAGGAKSCGTDIDAKGVGEPCTRNSECRSELSCVGGVCGARVDGGARDAASSDGSIVPADGASLDDAASADAALDGSR